MNKTAVIVIPTYNEAETISRMVDHLFTHTIPSIPDWTVRVLIVDGNSPDGTADLIREARKSCPGLDLVVEKEKEGIGAAYFKGFDYAVKNHHAAVLLEFDGDFQHPPETIPLLLEQIDAGADLVLGSRRVNGGSYPSGWGFKRLFFSRVGGLVARVLLFFPGCLFRRITDPTTGLKATRVEGFYDRLDFAGFRTRGFGYKVEMLYRLAKMDADIREIPLAFGLRESGQSKMTGQTPKEIFGTVLHLRWHDEATRRFLKFAVVGFSGFVINAVALEILTRSELAASLARRFVRLANHPRLGFIARTSSWAAAVAAECAIINNYVWNNFWTFSSHRDGRWGRFIVNALKFNLTSFGAILIQFLCIGLATFLIADTTLVRQVALVLTIGLVVIPYNWLMYNYVIWKTQRRRRQTRSDDR